MSGDTLSDLLRAVRLRGALFFYVEGADPWVAESPKSCEIIPAILPGVAQLDWAIRFGREAFVMPPRFLRMEALKFQQVLRPGARVTLSLEWLPEKGALQFRYQSAVGTHASGRVSFGEAP